MADPQETALSRWWRITQRAVLGVFVGLAIAAALAGRARFAVTPTLNWLTLGAGAVFLATGIVEEILERRKLIPKSRASTLFEDDELPPPRPPPPIVEAAEPEAFAPAPEPRAGEPEPTLTPLRGGALPESFAQTGGKVVWRIERDDEGR